MKAKKKPMAEFKVLPNGPLQVSGNFTITDRDGKTLKTQDPAFLCRCGGSKNKPFCDGSHRKVGLRD